MQINTVNTLTFTFRAANGKYKLTEDIIQASAETVGVMFHDFKALPLAHGDDTVMRTTQVQIQGNDLDTLTLYWTQLQAALALIGVEASSP